MATAELRSSSDKFATFARSSKGDETARRASAFAKPGGTLRVVSERNDNGEAQPSVSEEISLPIDEGIRPWLDAERIFAGDAFPAKLEKVIAEPRNIALCIGPHGLGRWQEVEYRAAYQRFIEIEELDDESAPARTEARVIPVLLPGATEIQIPHFSRQLHRVALSASGDAKHRAPMQEFVQTILGTSGRFAGGF